MRTRRARQRSAGPGRDRTPSRRRGPRLLRSVRPADVRGILQQHLLASGQDLVPDLARSRGSWLRDARTGRVYLDFFGFYGTSPIGHNPPCLLRPEVRSRLLRAAVNKPSNSDFQGTEMALFVDTFSKVAAPPSLPHYFFVDGGTLAVENALKAAFDWKVRKNLARGAHDERGHQVLHFRQAFHGRSGYCLSLTNTFDKRKTAYFPKFAWPRIPNPKIPFPLDRENLRRVEEEEAGALDAIRRAIAQHGDDIAALLIEPIQGEGGDNHFRGEFLRSLRRICDEHEIFYILDEVQTGFGTTGKWWCYQHFGFEPDAIAFGKKAQVCGILVSRRIDEVPENVFRVPGRINSTWGGSLVDMVRSTVVLECIAKEDLVANAAEVGTQLLGMIQEIAAEFPDRVSNVRGRGLFLAFDLPGHEMRDAVFENTFREGVLVLRSGERSIRFRPALTLTPREAAEGAARVRAAIRRTKGA